MPNNTNEEPAEFHELDPQLRLRGNLIAAGAEFFRGQGGREYALLAPGSSGRTQYFVLELDGDEAAILGMSGTAEGAQRLLEGYIQGTIQAQAERFFSWLDEREAKVGDDVSRPLREAGYEVVHTGGGCLAWILRLTPDGDSHILITSNNDIDGDPTAPVWDVGRYDGDGWINLEESFTLSEAIRTAQLLPPAIGADGEQIQAIYRDLALALAAYEHFPGDEDLGD